jgi:hypothetical protein
VSHVEELRRELGAVGIRGRLRARILAEAAEHVQDAGSAERFGSPRELANVFAAELGAVASRRAAVSAFAALAVAGAVYATSFLAVALSGAPPADGLLAPLALIVVIVAPQLAFVAGSLGLLRTLRVRREPVLPTAELTAINRRVRVALLAGLATMAGLALYAVALRGELPGWCVTFTLVAAPAAGALLLAAAVPAARAASLRPRLAGEARDVFDDLGAARVAPWRFARRVALAAGAVVWLSAAVQGDPLDGLVTGLYEAVACLGGFALLGRYLSIRR